MAESGELTREEKVAIAARAYRDPVFFCKFFFEHLFPTDIPWFHRALLAILTGQCDFLLDYGEVQRIVDNFVYEDSEGNPRPIFEWDGEKIRLHHRRLILLMLPRGFSKTTIAGVAMPVRDIVYRDVPFGAYVSEAAPHAKMQLNNVKRELTTNLRIRELFGAMKPGLRDDPKWSEELFETLNGCAMAARGRGGQIRGLNHLGNRPSKIICDDLEDKESVSTDLQREKVREWAYGDLIPALPSEVTCPEAGIVALGTLLHPDALLETWSADPEWTVVRLSAYDKYGAKKGEPIWPELFPREVLEAKKASFARAGQLHVYYMEYENEVRNPETQRFKRSYFQYQANPDEAETFVHHATYIDPAFSHKRGADDTVIITCGITDRGRIFVRDCWGKRGASELEKVDEYFRQTKLYGSRFNGVESVAAQVAFVSTLQTEMFRRRHYFEITPVNHKTKKEDRIDSILQPRFANGYILFCSKFPKLEGQLLDFHPVHGAAHDDYPDALAGCVRLLDPTAALAGGEDLAKDQFEPLDMEEYRWA